MEKLGWKYIRGIWILNNCWFSWWLYVLVNSYGHLTSVNKNILSTDVEGETKAEDEEGNEETENIEDKGEEPTKEGTDEEKKKTEKKSEEKKNKTYIPSAGKYNQGKNSCNSQGELCIGKMAIKLPAGKTRGFY